MALTARRLGRAMSENARERIHNMRAYPTIDTWMNPLTRGLARHFAHQDWLKAQDELDFTFRMSDADIAGVKCVQFETEKTRASDRLILYVHGGGSVSGSPRVNASMILPVCQLTGIEAIGPEYSLVPEARFPTQIEEIDCVYKGLVAKRPNARVVLFADSIGGSIALAAVMKWRDESMKLPEGMVLISPAVDGDGASDTHRTVDGNDPLMRSYGGRNCRRLFSFYAPGENLKDPRVSPIYGDFRGLPPTLIHVGTREILLGDSARLSEAARRAGVNSTLRLFDGMYHLFHMHWDLPETKAAHSDIADFILAL